MEIKQSTVFRVPVKLRLTATGLGKTGLAYSQVTVYIHKQGQSSASQKTLISADWLQIDGTNFMGVYDLELSATDTNTIGFIKYSVAALDCGTYHGIVEIVAQLASDIYTRQGAPAGASMSADAAAIKADTGQTAGRVTGNVALAATALSTAQWTNGRAANLDNLDSLISTVPANVWKIGRAAHATTGDMGEALKIMYLVNRGHVKINKTTKRIEIYNEANSAILFEMALSDLDGVATATNPTERNLYP